MGKHQEKPKTTVTAYGMSIHFGICAGPVDYMSGLFIDEKRAWMPDWPRTITGVTTNILELTDLFGGTGKEGGVMGSVTWLPGYETQVFPSELAAKFDRTSATMPAYRGIASIFFSHYGSRIGDFGGTVDGFYWRMNSPYLPGVWVEVARASTLLNDVHSRIFRSTIAGAAGPGLDIGNLGFANRAYKTDTWGDYCVKGCEIAPEVTDVINVTTGVHRTYSPGSGNFGGSIHITRDNEIIQRIDDGGAGNAIRIRDIDSLAVKQTISGFPTGAQNWGYWCDDIVMPDGSRRMLGRLQSGFSNRWMLLGKADAADDWAILWTDVDYDDGVGEAISEVSMGPQYAYSRKTDATGYVFRVTWASFVEDLLQPASIGARGIRLVHYFEPSDEVIILCTNGDLLVYNPDLSVLKRSRIGNGADFGSIAGLGSKRLSIGGGLIAVFESLTIDNRNLHLISVASLATVRLIDIDASSLVEKNSDFDYMGANNRHTGVFVTGHSNPSAFWFLDPGPFDSNPAHIIYDAMTNTDWGMGAPESIIDFGSFTSCGETLFNERFGLSMIWTASSSIEDFISEVLDHIEATLFVNPRTGLLTLKLIRNDYSVPSLPVFTPDNSVVTNFSRKLWGETINEIVASWTNPKTEDEESVVAQDLANIESQGGIVSDGRNYYGVRRSNLAMRLAQRDLRSASTPLAKCDLEVNREAWALLPGDCCVLDSPEDGIDQIIMRVGPVDYGKPGDSTVRVSLMEDVFSLALAEYDEPPESEWIDPSEDPSPADFTRIITLPYFVVVNVIAASVTASVDYPEVFAGVLAAEAGFDTDTFRLLGQTTNAAGATVFASFGTKSITSRATLPDDIAVEVETTVLTFPDRSQGNGPVVGGLMLIEGTDETDSEVCLVADLGDDGYVFWRGALDTVPRAWPTGTPVWFVDESMDFADDFDIRAEGETVNYKVLPQTSRGTLNAASAPTVSETMTARPHLPLRPADIKVNGDDGFAGSVDITGIDPIPVTWARRNRETETAIIKAWDDGDVTPETGQTTIIEVLDPTGTSVVTTHAGLTGTSFNVPAASFAGNASGWIRVGAERDGHRELQAYAIECVIPTPVSVAVTGVEATASVGSVTVVAAGAGVVLTYRGTTNSSTSSGAQSALNVPTGTAAADRLVVVVIQGGRNVPTPRTLVSVTIEGIAATIDAQIGMNDGAFQALTVAIASAVVPTGTDADVSLSFNNTVQSASISVYTVTGLASTTRIDTTTATGNDPTTSTLDTSAGGIVIAAIGSLTPTSGTFTLTGVTQDYTAEVTGSSATMRVVAASTTATAASSGYTITAASTAGFEAFAAVSWA